VASTVYIRAAKIWHSVIRYVFEVTQHVINELVCTVKRPPVEDILSFLESEDWIVQNMFGGLDLAKVAHGLAGKNY